MSDINGSPPAEERNGVVKDRSWVPQNGEDAYSIQGAMDKAEQEPQNEDAFKLGNGLATRQRGGGPRLSALIGILLAGFVAAMLSGVLLLPVRRQQHRRSLAEAWASVTPHDEPWALPSVSEAESQSTPSLVYGKEEIAAAVGEREVHDFPPRGSLGQEMLGALGDKVSKGKRSSLLGAIIRLKNIQKLGSNEVDKEGGEFYVNKYMGENTTCVFVEVVQVATLKRYAMRLQSLPPTVGGETVSPQLAKAIHQESIVASTTAMLEAVGNAPLDKAAEERGLALAESVATIANVDEPVRCSRVYASGDVQLMELFYGNLEDVFTSETQLSMDAKLYAARRVLHQLLLLQSAGVSTNNLKLETMYMQKDGSFFFGGFDETSRIGDVLGRVGGGASRDAKNKMLLAVREALSRPEARHAHSKLDMWDLGVCLYRIFTDGSMPFDLDKRSSSRSVLPILQEEQLRGSDLREQLFMAGVPHRWATLIMRLLEPDSRQRIDAQTVVMHFPDLLRG
ncbi:uncharacterized protein EMH_0057520 [Eimeria mitis]|uniref:Protein kinase domain-containing protein n=1 Tax=Eimeria mitis TaxID=44415 RepID=U6K088_9EIME|nr:uncharacterized protein EMH_0057520 [Eimeria mitis]CDJ30371.1 hypothetical protein, conserved [Eimeria mitis]